MLIPDDYVSLKRRSGVRGGLGPFPAFRLGSGQARRDDADALDDLDAARAREQLEEARRRHEQDADERTEAALRVEMARVEIAESRGQ